MMREYQDEDYGGVAEVWRKCFSGTPRPIDSKEVISRMVKRCSPTGLFLVEERDGKIIGTVFAGYDGRQATIHRLAVLPEYREKGIVIRAHEEAGSAKAHRDTGSRQSRALRDGNFQILLDGAF
jgi:ribosomal protein S18 acetylase RimI-like enzyme